MLATSYLWMPDYFYNDYGEEGQVNDNMSDVNLPTPEGNNLYWEENASFEQVKTTVQCMTVSRSGQWDPLKLYRTKLYDSHSLPKVIGLTWT